MSALATETLSAKGDRMIRGFAVGLIVIVASSSFTLSYAGLTYLATESGIHQGLAFLFPLCIDGMLLLGSVSSLHSNLRQRTPLYGNLLVLFGVVLSIWGNIESAGGASNSVQAKIVHGVAPAALFLSVEVLIQILRNKITVTHEAAAEAQRQAERELKRQQKAQEQAARRTGAKRGAVKASEPSRSIKAAGAEVGSVDAYKAIIDGLDPLSSKASKVDTLLRQFPDARSAHIAMALGVPAKSVNTTIVRVRERVLAENTAGNADADFHEIVKDFAPAGE